MGLKKRPLSAAPSPPKPWDRPPVARYRQNRTTPPETWLSRLPIYSAWQSLLSPVCLQTRPPAVPLGGIVRMRTRPRVHTCAHRGLARWVTRIRKGGSSVLASFSHSETTCKSIVPGRTRMFGTPQGYSRLLPSKVPSFVGITSVVVLGDRMHGRIRPRTPPLRITSFVRNSVKPAGFLITAGSTDHNP